MCGEEVGVREGRVLNHYGIIRFTLRVTLRSIGSGYLVIRAGLICEWACD